MVTYYAIYTLNTANGEWMMSAHNFTSEWAARNESKVYSNIGFEISIRAYTVKEW